MDNRWIPFLAFFLTLIIQSVFITRYASGIEAKQTYQGEQLTGVLATVTTLSSQFASQAIPLAQTNWRLSQVESAAQDCQKRVGELERARAGR